jgi:hypothetical protein
MLSDDPPDGSRRITITFVPSPSLAEARTRSPFKGLVPLSPETELALIAYLYAQTWEEAREILETYPLHLDGWAVSILRSVLEGGRLSIRDQAVFREHIEALEVACEQGLDDVNWPVCYI